MEKKITESGLDEESSNEEATFDLNRFILSCHFPRRSKGLDKSDHTNSFSTGFPDGCLRVSLGSFGFNL
jgi:hypothetical protein